MICPNCKKKIAEPLDMFNGMLVCPKCKKEIKGTAKLKITKKGDEFFRLSELAFLRYLSPKSYASPQNAVVRFEDGELLEKAIEYCTVAANDGHPKAIFKMAYYNEHYLETVRAKSDRIKKAFDFYETLFTFDGVNIPVDKGAIGLGNEEFENLKRQAAINALKLYEHYSAELKGANKYDFENNKRRIEAKFGRIEVNVSESAKKSGVDRAKYIIGILRSCFERKKAPLFGIYSLTGNELKDLIAAWDALKEKRSKFSKLSKNDLDIYYTKAEKDQKLSDQSEVKRFADEIMVQECLEELLGDETVYLLIFNSAGKHQYLSKAQTKKVAKEFREDDFVSVRELIEYSDREYLFYDDDVVRFARGRNVTGSAKKLVEYIIKGETY